MDPQDEEKTGATGTDVVTKDEEFAPEEGEDGGEEGEGDGKKKKSRYGSRPRSRRFLPRHGKTAVSGKGEQAAVSAGGKAGTFARSGEHAFRTGTRKGAGLAVRGGARALEAAGVAGSGATAGGSLVVSGATEAALRLGPKAVNAGIDAVKRPTSVLEIPGKVVNEGEKWGKRIIYIVSAVVIIILMILFLLTGSVAQQSLQQPEQASSSAQTSDATLETNIVFPPNLTCIPGGGQIRGEYCMMPDPTDGSYVIHGTRWGSKQMIGVLYTVAKRWKQTYPEGFLIINDISARLCPYHPEDHRCGGYHISHAWGVTVDLVATTNKKDCVADMVPRKGGRCYFEYRDANGNIKKAKYNPEATVRLGEFLIDTGYMHKILHNAVLTKANYDPATRTTSPTTVNKAIFDYAKSKYPDRFKVYLMVFSDAVSWVKYHEDHFHLYIDRDQSRYSTNRGAFNDIFNRSKLGNCSSYGVRC